ncbi:hypothetical protein [Streptomyces violascens]|uniref:hypothetical protein n=1 Tax=Streptomyces violascens TaxID=67381 RepID=UPI00368625CB
MTRSRSSRRRNAVAPAQVPAARLAAPAALAACAPAPPALRSAVSGAAVHHDTSPPLRPCAPRPITGSGCPPADFQGP